MIVSGEPLQACLTAPKCRVLWEGRRRSGYDDRHADEYLSSNHPLLLRLDGRSLAQLVSTISEMAAVR